MCGGHAEIISDCVVFKCYICLECGKKYVVQFDENHRICGFFKEMATHLLKEGHKP